MFVFPRFYTEFLPLKKPHIQWVTIFFLPVKPAGRIADNSHTNSTETTLSGDISPLPLYDRIDYEGINLTYFSVFI